MGATPTLVAITLGALIAQGDVQHRTGQFEFTAGQGYRNETFIGDAYGLTYIGPEFGPANVFFSLHSLPGDAYLAGAGLRIERAIDDQWSWSSGLSLNHYHQANGPNLGADTLAGIHASLIYQVTDRAAIGLGYDHYSHGYFLGDKNPGWNQISLRLYIDF